ncbi:MAG: cell division protein FtsZ [Pseudomonadales bacterium]
MFEIVEATLQQAVIKVIGVGGGGGNAVEHMVNQDTAGVDFVCANTDAQALDSLSARTLLQLGSEVTKGLGAGSNPMVGREAALEDRERLKETMTGADMVFITAGMGGGTGTGAAPIVAEIAREMGILSVAVVTKPFLHEGKKRMEVAESGIAELAKHVDSLITIPNDKLLSIFGEDTQLMDAFASVDDVLCHAVQGVADVIIRPGKINVDFADVRTVMSEMGAAMIGSGHGSGETRARDAAEAAIRSPLLEDIDLSGAKGVLVNIAASTDMTLSEFSEVGRMVSDFADDGATVVIGTVMDASLADEIRVTLVATGLGGASRQPEEERGLRLAADSQAKVAGDGSHDYADFDAPAALRHSGHSGHGSQAGAGQDAPEPADSRDSEFLDIPTFLRRQAD